MANGENTQLVMDLLRIGKEYLWPVAKDAFYRYRDRILEAENVSPEERASLLDWMNATDLGGGSKPDEPTKPADPRPDPMPDLGKYGVVVDKHPKASDYPAGGVVYQYQTDERWFVLQRGVGIGKPSTPPWYEVEFA